MFRVIAASDAILRPAETYITEFIQQSQLAERTARTYEKALNYFFTVCNKTIETITEQDIIDYRAKCEQTIKTTTANTYITIIKSYFTYLFKHNFIASNIAADIKRFKQTTGFKKDYLQPADLKKLLSVVSTKRDKAIIALMATSGLRTIEIARANIADFSNSKLFVHGKGRSEADDFVVLNQNVASLIADYLSERQITDASEPLFLTQRGRFNERSISRLAADYLKKAGLKTSRITAHSLRHSAITNAIKNGASLQEAQTLARHSNINTTMLYAHIIDKESNRAVDFASAGIFE